MPLHAAPRRSRPHVVIVGAGASRAALPNGDRNGQRLPLMEDLVSTTGLAPLLDARGVAWRGSNFEQVYSSLAADTGASDLIGALERAIFDYFSALELPSEPTLYDHLMFSLRPKDVVATFNWDPFLFQAGVRAWQHGHRSTPMTLFLHGNVAIGSCLEHKPNVIGQRTDPCGRCGRPLTPSPLLYPVATKNYAGDRFIARSWELAQAALRRAYLLTIFGYSAPVADTEAVTLMKAGWGDPRQRDLEEVEIIDIKSEEELTATWDPFIHTHHYRATASFYDSLLGKYPRRSCEAVWGGLMEIAWPAEQTIPRQAGWPELVEWYRPLIEAETMSATAEPD